MARKNRRDIVNAAEVGVYLVSSRTVRRAFLMGKDPVTGQDRSYRQRVIEKRLEDLATVFAVEVLDYSTVDNHCYVVVRIRPDLVRAWSDQEVARRWLRVNRSMLKLEPEPSQEMIARFVGDEKRLARGRMALSSLSEFMGCLKQPIAREANMRDRASDNFWGGRFESVPLEDETAVAACGSYVNLDPILARRAEGLGRAEHTSAFLRLQDELASGDREERSGWLQPVTVETSEVCEQGVLTGRRASNDGFLRMTFQEQREVIESLLNFENTVHNSGNAHLHPELPAVMERLGVSAEHWSDTVHTLRIRFQRELRIMARMIEEAREAVPQGWPGARDELQGSSTASGERSSGGILNRGPGARAGASAEDRVGQPRKPGKPASS